MVLPVMLFIISFCGYANNQRTNNEEKSIFHSIYFYTSLMLVFYACVKTILEYIFNVCADEVMFHKRVDLDQTVPSLEMFIDNVSESHHQMIVVRKIYKLRYSSFRAFEWIVKTCWFLGIDSPILIPQKVLDELSNDSNPINLSEDAYLHLTLNNISQYRPQVYEVSPMTDLESNSMDVFSTAPEIKKVITHVDKSICDIQLELFNKSNQYSE